MFVNGDSVRATVKDAELGKPPVVISGVIRDIALGWAIVSIDTLGSSLTVPISTLEHWEF